MPPLLLLFFCALVATGCGVDDRDKRADSSMPTPDRDASGLDAAGPGNEPPDASQSCEHVSAPAAAGETLAVEPGLGWTLRSDAPYPRVAHSAVLDTDRDRMLIFGGAANDVWALELAGEHANTWSQIIVRGDHPPGHSYFEPGSFYSPDAAVYVPERQSMIVVVNSLSPSERTGVWELTLSGEPSWHQIAQLDALEGPALQGAPAVYDACAQRILLLGGVSERGGLWSLSVGPGAEPSWTRIAAAPPESEDSFYSGHALLLDEARNRVVLLGGISPSAKIWTLDLDDPEWQILNERGDATLGYSFAAALDPRRDALVIIGDREQPESVATYSFANDGWESASTPRAFEGATMVLDAERDRLVVFGGTAGGESAPGSETWALSLDSKAWQQLNDVSTEPLTGMAERSVVYDPEREAMIAFGDYTNARTYAHALDRDADAWTTLQVGATPVVSNGAAIYDPSARAVISFGGRASDDSRQLSRLSSADGAQWEELEASGEGPLERSGHTMVYDSQHKRAIIFAGARDTTGIPRREDLVEVWALSLEGTPTWTELKPTGIPPGGGEYMLAIYDPVGRRMLALEQSLLSELDLDGEPRWSYLQPSGPAPDGFLSRAALYDADARRMIVVESELSVSRVYALELETLVWHEFCVDTITPASIGNAVMTPDGIFMVVDNVSYRFDLSTPYCD